MYAQCLRISVCNIACMMCHHLIRAALQVAAAGAPDDSARQLAQAAVQEITVQLGEQTTSIGSGVLACAGATAVAAQS